MVSVQYMEEVLHFRWTEEKHLVSQYAKYWPVESHLCTCVYVSVLETVPHVLYGLYNNVLSTVVESGYVSNCPREYKSMMYHMVVC